MDSVLKYLPILTSHLKESTLAMNSGVFLDSDKWPTYLKVNKVADSRNLCSGYAGRLGITKE